MKTLDANKVRDYFKYGKNDEPIISPEIDKAIIDMVEACSVDWPQECTNQNYIYHEVDQFICSNCGIELQDWNRVERDEDNGDITYREYVFKFCPECGAKVI